MKGDDLVLRHVLWKAKTYRVLEENHEGSCGGTVGAQVNLRPTRATKLQSQHRSTPIKVDQSWLNEVKSHMRRPKSMEKGN